ARRHRPARGGPPAVRGHAGAAQSPRPALRGYRSQDRRALGQLPADLFAGRAHRLRHAAVEELGGSILARLVIVSNRLALPNEKPGRAGGLAVALRESLQRRGGLWFGWSGETTPGAARAPEMLMTGRTTSGPT